MKAKSKIDKKALPLPGRVGRPKAPGELAYVGIKVPVEVLSRFDGSIQETCGTGRVNRSAAVAHAMELYIKDNAR